MEDGAGDGLRTRYLNLGKVALYRLSYSRSAVLEILPNQGGRMKTPVCRGGYDPAPDSSAIARSAAAAATRR